MKKLIVLGVMLCLYTNVFSQEYAANTKVSSNVMQQVDFQDDVDDAVRSKNFSKTFAADRTDKINLNNQFGTILIKVWERKEVKIDIAVRAYSSNENEAQKLIDEVTIAANKSGDLISCKTTIGKGNRWSGRNKRREVKIGYVVYLPAANALTVAQQFGTVTMGDFSGPLSAKVEYGDFNAGNLSGANNYISVQYGKANIAAVNKAVIKHEYGAGLTLGTAGTLDLDAQYTTVRINSVRGDAVIRQQYGSGLTLTSVNNLDLDIQYSTANIGTIKGNAIVKQQYNALKIGTVGKLNLSAEYAGVNIGTLRGDGNFNVSYNNLNINEVGAACKNLTIDAEYVDVSLGFAQGYNGDFNVRKSYGSFRGGANVKLRSQDGDDETKNYTGRIGNGGGGAAVRVKAEYGSIVFK